MKYGNLSLGELELAACSALTVLLSLDHSRVSGKEAVGMECRAVGLVLCYECACDAMAAGAGLTGGATTADGDEDVELALVVSNLERLLDLINAKRIAEVLFNISSVDCNLAVSLAEINTSDCGLSASGTLTEIDASFFCLSHSYTSQISTVMGCCAACGCFASA